MSGYEQQKMSTSKGIALSGKTLDDLEKFVTSANHPKFRAKQLHDWLYKKCASSFDEMTNLSKEFKEFLLQNTIISSTEIVQKQVSKDGTVKYILKLIDGNIVEAVLMSYDNRPNITACISTQVGCAVGCKFCATGKKGFTRNLKAEEIVDQILTIQRDSGKTVTNLVYMGQGEPLLNYDETVKSIKFFNKEMEIGMRRITVSTSGIVPKIYKLSEINRQLILALSLHAPNHEIRKKIMPIENKYPIEDVIKAVKYYSEKAGRRFTIEYTLIDGINDSEDNAKELNQLLRGLNCNFNIIPFNPVDGCNYKRPSTDKINSFRKILEKENNKVTVRLERGADITAACGQLAGKFTA